MRIPWKLIGLAGVAGVAGGAVVVRRRRGQQEYDPDALRAKLHERLAETRDAGVGGEGAEAAAVRPHRPSRGPADPERDPGGEEPPAA